jgi:hypothetical protein
MNVTAPAERESSSAFAAIPKTKAVAQALASSAVRRISSLDVWLSTVDLSVVQRERVLWFQICR